MEQVKVDLRGARVLIVDDTQANLDVLCELLEAQGYKISMAPNGEIALRIAGRVAPDLILLDVMMPGIDGFEVCRRLKQEETTREIPVIFITAENLAESVVAGFEAGGVDYITKPFHDAEVVVRVQTHLKIDRLHRDLEQANRALNVANRHIEEEAERKLSFLASMSHELRTPLTAIKGFVDNLLDGIGGSLAERQRSSLTKVTQNTDHLMSLINDILDLSKIEAGRMDVTVAPFGVKDLIASCCDSVKPMLNPGVALTCHVSEDITAHTDEARMRQIVLNLLSNAAKFTEAGEIVVRVEEDGPSNGGASLVISVSDTGVGIPADHLEAIFDEFRQVKGSDKQHKGTGLGLSITKKLAELLRGTIRVESVVGKGSTFTVQIPVVYCGD